MAPLVLITVSLFAAPDIAIHPAQPRLGDPVEVYVVGFTHEGVPGSAEAFGYRFSLMPVGDEVMRAVVAIPSDIEPASYPVKLRHPNASAPWPASLPVVGRTFETSHLTVAKKFTKKKRNETLKKRLKREQDEIQAVWTSTPTPAGILGTPQRPTKTRLTGVYGTARVFNKTRRSVHYGVDLNGKVGTPVYASSSGTVVMSSMRWGSGGTLILDHGGGVYSTYFHLSKRRVDLGAKVKRGQRIGDIGRSGRVTGPHLHFGVAIRAAYADGSRKGRIRSLYVDPEGFWRLSFGAGPPATTTSKATKTVNKAK